MGRCVFGNASREVHGLHGIKLSDGSTQFSPGVRRSCRAIFESCLWKLFCFKIIIILLFVVVRKVKVSDVIC